MGPTWAALTDLNATDLCALGNWQEKGEVIRYHRAKTLHAQALKLCLRDAVGIMKANAEASWQEVSPAELRRQFILDLRKAAEVIGERDKFIFKQVMGLGTAKEKSVRLRSGVSRWAPAAFRPAEPETGASLLPVAVAKQREVGRNLRNHVLPNLEAGQSIYVHCAAGIHRAPFGCALLLSHLGVGTLDACVARIGKLRAIKPEEAVSRSPDMSGPGRVGCCVLSASPSASWLASARACGTLSRLLPPPSDPSRSAALK